MQSANEQERGKQPVSRGETTVANSFRTVLSRTATGDLIGESDDLRRALGAMEYFIPEVLCEIHPEWNDEGLDGVLPVETRKTAEREVEILGHCILISDQTVVPLHVRLQVHSSEDRVNWLECRLGEESSKGMVRRPYGSSDWGEKKLHSVKDNLDSIDWAYKVCFGDED